MLVFEKPFAKVGSDVAGSNHCDSNFGSIQHQSLVRDMNSHVAYSPSIFPANRSIFWDQDPQAVEKQVTHLATYL
jgi:hypothetical protein